ncbi:MAG: hypothetical protein MUC42_02995 [Bryobacter sp.]|nr:hypothetical protein [Bryobacter sp.]
MRHFFSQQLPPFEKVLFVESGGRHLVEKLLSYTGHPLRFDLFTCYAGAPKGLDPKFSAIYLATDYPDWEARKKLTAEFRANRYDTIGIICSGEPILTRWKWLLAATIPAKLLILNENGDFFYADYTKLNTIRQFMLYRAGLSGAGAILTPARLLVFPFTLAVLAVFALRVHLKRQILLRRKANA